MLSTLLTASLISLSLADVFQQVRVDKFEGLDPASASIRTVAMTMHSLNGMENQFKKLVQRLLHTSLLADPDIAITNRQYENNLLKTFDIKTTDGTIVPIECDPLGQSFPTIDGRTVLAGVVSTAAPDGKVYAATAELCGISDVFRIVNQHNPSFYTLNVRDYIELGRAKRLTCYGSWIVHCPDNEAIDYSNDIKELHNLITQSEADDHHYIEQNAANLVRIVNWTNIFSDDLFNLRRFDIMWASMHQLVPFARAVIQRVIFEKTVASGAQLSMYDMDSTVSNDLIAMTGPYHSRPALYRSHANSSHIMLLASWVESNISAQYLTMTPHIPATVKDHVCYTTKRTYILSSEGFLSSQRSLAWHTMYDDPLYRAPTFKKIKSDNLISEQGYHRIGCLADDVYSKDPYVVPTSSGCSIYYPNGTVSDKCEDNNILGVKGSQFTFYAGYQKYYVIQVPDHNLFVDEEYSHIKMNFLTKSMDNMKHDFDKDQKALKSWSLIGVHPYHAQLMWAAINSSICALLFVLVMINFYFMNKISRSQKYLEFKDRRIIKQDLMNKESTGKRLKSLVINGVRTMTSRNGREMSFKLLGNEYEMSVDKSVIKSMDDGKNMFTLSDGNLTEADGFYLSLDGELVNYLLTKPSQTGKSHGIMIKGKEYTVPMEQVQSLPDLTINWKVVNGKLMAQ